MIVKKIFNPWTVLQNVSVEMSLSLVSSLSVLMANRITGFNISLPWSIIAIMGSALAIFIAFRNQSSYNRWWEARTLWAGIFNHSRIFARQIIANVDASVFLGKISKAEGHDFQKELIYRQIAFAHCLRSSLREEDSWEHIRALIPPDEFNSMLTKMNKPNFLLLQQGLRVREGMLREYLGAFDNISIEPGLSALNNWQSQCEKIKQTPLPMNYQYFTKLFLIVFIIILPLSLFPELNRIQAGHLLLPCSLLIAFVFSVMNRVGEINEDPFENRMQDIPMSAICTFIERDLKEMLDEENLPEVQKANTAGYLM